MPAEPEPTPGQVVLLKLSGAVSLLREAAAELDRAPQVDAETLSTVAGVFKQVVTHGGDVLDFLGHHTRTLPRAEGADASTFSSYHRRSNVAIVTARQRLMVLDEHLARFATGMDVLAALDMAAQQAKRGRAC